MNTLLLLALLLTFLFDQAAASSPVMEPSMSVGPMQSFYPDPDELLSAVCEICSISLDYCAHAMTNHVQHDLPFTESTFRDHPEWPHSIPGLDVLPDLAMPELSPDFGWDGPLAMLSINALHEFDQHATPHPNEAIIEHIQSTYTPGDRLAARRSHNKRQAPRDGGFPCTFGSCPKTFNRACDLTRHQKTHLKHSERPHKCTTCEVSFLYPKDLARHQRTHNRSSTPTLEYCTVPGCENNGFSRHDNLRRHMRTQHGHT